MKDCYDFYYISVENVFWVRITLCFSTWCGTMNLALLIIYEPIPDRRDLLTIKVKSEIFTEKEKPS